MYSHFEKDLQLEVKMHALLNRSFVRLVIFFLLGIDWNDANLIEIFCYFEGVNHFIFTPTALEIDGREIEIMPRHYTDPMKPNQITFYNRITMMNRCRNWFDFQNRFMNWTRKTHRYNALDNAHNLNNSVDVWQVETVQIHHI